MEDKLTKFLASDAATRNTKPRLASELFLRGILRNFYDIDKLLGKVNPNDELQRFARNPMVLSILRVMAYELMWLPHSTVQSSKLSVGDLIEKCDVPIKLEREWILSATQRLCKSFEKTHLDCDRKAKVREEKKRLQKEQGVDVPAARPKASVPGPASKRRGPLGAGKPEPGVARNDTKRPKGAVPCAAVEDEAIMETTPTKPSASAAAGGSGPFGKVKPMDASAAHPTTPKSAAKTKGSPLALDKVEEVGDEEPAALITIDSPNKSEEEQDEKKTPKKAKDVQLINDEGKVLPVEDGEDEDNDGEEDAEDADADAAEDEEEEEDEDQEEVVSLEDQDQDQDLDQADEEDDAAALEGMLANDKAGKENDDGDAEADPEEDGEGDADGDEEDEEEAEEAAEAEEGECPEAEDAKAGQNGAGDSEAPAESEAACPKPETAEDEELAADASALEAAEEDADEEDDLEERLRLQLAAVADEEDETEGLAGVAAEAAEEGGTATSAIAGADAAAGAEEDGGLTAEDVAADTATVSNGTGGGDGTAEEENGAPSPAKSDTAEALKPDAADEAGAPDSS